ncbi:DNA cytosine methyltransferase [uncultured Lacinutrix sp.]|uniref:DNA cytosine methyltransferase n=1 Tax=uncultured Lacinutrix sp. TaxID=574032 RepID=UPI00260E6B23|nr:DNA (cytosine-5-)-methyltransferase [uncultured Lacinutrix sp.]
MNVNDFSVVDLFCGIGGLTHGFIKEKFKVDAGIDFDETCKYAFEKNNKSKFFHEDITTLTSEELVSKYTEGKRKILVGCAPCQPFSIYNQKGGKNTKDKLKLKNEKWKLLYSFANLIDEVEPEIISMENVPLLLTFDKGKVFKDFVKRLKDKNYFVTYHIVNAQDYGVPQRRKRLILFGSKHGEVKLIEKTIKKDNYVTVKDAIGHLPPVEDGIAHPKDSIHVARKLTPLNKKRIQASKQGGTWQDWDESLWLECHKKDSGKNFKSVYGRMKWDDVAPTMTTYCIGLSNGRFGHPEQDRAITLREAALIQSFPNNYKFVDPKKEVSNNVIARQIGNAVPVGLGVVVAKSIKNHIKELESN